MDISALLKKHIREVPNFPVNGVLFKDITPLFLQPDLIKKSIDAMADYWQNKGITKILGIESRGFLLGPALASALGAGFVIVRKAGKLPPETHSISYSLEYGSATIEIVKDAIKPNDKVLIHDDLLATGGTAAAAAALAQNMKAEVCGFSFLIHLAFLAGEKNLNSIHPDIHALITYEK